MNDERLGPGALTSAELDAYASCIVAALELDAGQSLELELGCAEHECVLSSFELATLALGAELVVCDNRETAARDPVAPGAHLRLRVIGGARVPPWDYVVWPSRAWAEAIAPSDPGMHRRLAELILEACRCQSPRARAEHLDEMRSRARRLRDIRAIWLRGPGIDVSGEIDGERAFETIEWQDGAAGGRICVNIPAQQILAALARDSLEGPFKLTRPLQLSDQDPRTGDPRPNLVQGISGRFQSGRLAQLSCSERDQQWLIDTYFSEERGTLTAREIGLVDQGAVLARAGIVFGDVVLDRGSGTHIALGARSRLRPGERGREGPRHDLVIGSERLDVIGVDDAGRPRRLLAAGRWVA